MCAEFRLGLGVGVGVTGMYEIGPYTKGHSPSSSHRNGLLLDLELEHQLCAKQCLGNAHLESVVLLLVLQ